MNNISVFSEFTRGTSIHATKVAKPAMTANNSVSNSVEAENKNMSKKEKILKTLKTVAPIALPLIAIPVSVGITYKIANKNTGALKKEIENLASEVSTLKTQNADTIAKIAGDVKAQSSSVKILQREDTKIWKALLAVAGVGGAYKTGQLTSEDKDEITENIKSRMNNITYKADNAQYLAQDAMKSSGTSLSKKYLENVNGIELLKNINTGSRNNQKYLKAIEQIQTAAPKRLYNQPKIKPMEKGSTLWSVTSEFAPIKEGGLGSVPVDVQNNLTKLGINIPTFIPMYQDGTKGVFKQIEDKCIYTYKGQDFEVKKAAQFDINAYRGANQNTETVEVYVGKTKEGNQLVFLRNKNYFDDSIYSTGIKSEEAEKFAFFSKAVYEFAKIKNDMSSVKNLKIDDMSAFDSIKSPDGLILNDWQASPIAALARYKAPMENAHGELSDSAAYKLANMNMITIGHNAMYQGSTRDNNSDVQRYQSTGNILNTLFDKYSADIVKNADTLASKTDKTDSGLKNLDNVLIINKNDPTSNHTNLLNMGICLSDYFCPVSKNYAQEIISDEHPELSGELRWALNQRNNSNSLEGVINGNDFNNLSIEARKANIKKQTTLDYMTYNKQSSIDEVLKAREYNKINFYKNYILPFTLKNDESNHTPKVENIRKTTENLEYVSANNNVKLPELTDEELKETPVICSVGRFVSQKGIDVLADSIEKIMKNWEKDFPSKPKPIFYIAGQEGEDGRNRKYIEDLISKKLSPEDSCRVIFAHGYAPMTAMTAASDYFLMPSKFEPCGLTQGESFAVATPVIASAVGGIVDTVNRNDKTNGILTDKDKPLDSIGFYEAIKKGINIYFNDKNQYAKMVHDSLHEDFSWSQPGKKGSAYDYAQLIGYKKDDLNDVA